jgi:hypothetical protein
MGLKTWPVAAAVALAGCGRAAGKTPPAAACEVVQKGVTLPQDVKETSGIAESRRHAGVFWTHNDSGHHSALFAVSLAGRELGNVRLEGGKNHDWEDIAAAPCTDDRGTCLYIADTGNNSRDVGKKDRLKGPKALKPFVRLFEVPEPEPGDTLTQHAHEYHAEFPGGRRPDVEALIVLPDRSVYVVTKGNDGPIELWRWPPLKLHETGTFQPIRQLAPRPREVDERVTGASASPDGRYVAVRTYDALAFYRTADLLANGRPFAQLDLDPLAEPQGEAVYLANDGTVILTSEGPGAHHLPGTLARLRCSLPK